MRKADITSAWGMLAPPDAGWPLPGKPEEGCSTAGAVPAAGPKYSPKWHCNPTEHWARKARRAQTNTKLFRIKVEKRLSLLIRTRASTTTLPCQALLFHGAPFCSSEPAPGCWAARLCSHCCWHSSPPHHCQDPQRGKQAQRILSTHTPSARIPKYFPNVRSRFLRSLSF